jgi:sugar O-acyltransferase (sialic acid O-acetyltransferase NeuD family)
MIIYGASGHGKVIAEILEQNGITDLIFVDDDPVGELFLGYPLYHTSKLDCLKLIEVIIAVGSNRIRRLISEKLAYSFATAIHPSAQISKRSEIGEGTVVMAGVTVNSDAKIGKHIILNTNCSIDHDCILADYVHVSPNAALAGNVTVGESAHIGIGASVIQGIKIGEYATIGAGAAIIEDVPDYAVVVGVPGRIIKYNAFE